jgi:hypothetical protein
MMNKPLAFDFDGYELFAGDYVASDKKLYVINNIIKNTVSTKKQQVVAATVLELMHVKTTKIVKKKDFEVERLN